MCAKSNRRSASITNDGFRYGLLFPNGLTIAITSSVTFHADIHMHNTDDFSIRLRMRNPS